MERIVVGVDGSEGARDAFRWALAQARTVGARLEAVLVYPHTDPTMLYEVAPPIPASASDEQRKEAEERLRRAVASAEPETDGVDLELRVVQGRPADRLLAVAHGADLIVVGHRGLGGFRGLLLGSVSHQLVSHAMIPVVVVPEGGTYSTRTETML